MVGVVFDLTSFRVLMRNASSLEVKEIVLGVVAKEGSWRKAAAKYGVSHQTLQNWADGSKEHRQLFEFLEKARKDLKLSESAAYKKAIRK